MQAHFEIENTPWLILFARFYPYQLFSARQLIRQTSIGEGKEVTLALIDKEHCCNNVRHIWKGSACVYSYILEGRYRFA